MSAGQEGVSDVRTGRALSRKSWYRTQGVRSHVRPHEFFDPRGHTHLPDAMVGQAGWVALVLPHEFIHPAGVA
jgi:hypothetical protein